MSEKKLFFCGRAGLDNPGAWTKMMGEAEARAMIEGLLEAAGIPADRPIGSYSVDRHEDEEDSRFYRWGVDEPSFDGDDWCSHIGVRLELDGEVVHNDVRPSENDDDDEEHDPDCDVCAKTPATPS